MTVSTASTSPSTGGLRWLLGKLGLGSTQQSFATWVLSGTLLGCAFSAADALARLNAIGLSPAAWTWRAHLLASFTLYASVGTTFGLLLWLLSNTERAARLAGASIAISPRWTQSVGRFILLLLASAFAALWVFSSSFSPPSDPVAWVAFGIAAASPPGFMILVSVVGRWQRRMHRRFRMLLALSALLLGVGAAWLDMTVLVALYPAVHAIGELLTGMLWFAGLLSLLQELVSLDRQSRRAALTAAFVVAVAIVFQFTGLRSSVVALRHAAKHEAYAGRLISRGQRMVSAAGEASRRTPNEEASRRTMGRRDERSTDACAEAWWPTDAPMAPAPLRAAIAQNPNVVVFYVDTLRYDVASDPRVMPNVAKFARTALNFTQVYATGSDTRSSVPAMIRGNFDFEFDDEHNVLRVARAQGLRTTTVIGKSPRAFLGNHIPHFKFDEVVEVEDADADRKVWGYGAHRSTAAKLVDDSVAWLSRPERGRFFLWQFHYDLHGWRQIDDKDVERQARMYGVRRHGTHERWRYRTVAAAIDAEFGRFLRELDRLGLADETVVVFLADHGEGLGYQGFWLHSVFLWEDLVRVPLMIRVPGLNGERVDTPVSAIDVAPTLVRLLDPGASMLPYQGEDLLTQLGPDRPARRYPILMRAMIKEQVVRLGVVSADGRRKLVFPIESGQPELYDLSAGTPDDVDIAEREPETVDRMVPVVLEGALNPSVRRRHQRCQRRLTEPDPTADTLATESRRMNARAENSGDPS